MENREAFLVLNSIEGLEPRLLLELLAKFGSAREILTQDRKLLGAVAGDAMASNICRWEKHFDLEKELMECQRRSVQWMDWNDERYPEILRQIPQPPPILYFRGAFDARKDSCALGVVGARQATRYGVEIAKRLSQELAAMGFTIVSGMARGIDTAAHEGALEAKGRTIAVMGSGFADPYPRENLRLMEKIAAAGVVVSEFPLTRAPLPRNFPRRNRILSGLSLGIVVVEAARRSGSLITASHALEQGKSVFAVPGRLDSELSQGANALIQQGAKLIASTRDIVEDLQYLLPAAFLNTARKTQPRQPESVSMPVPTDLTAAQRKIYDVLEAEPTPVEEIIKLTGLPAQEVSGNLLLLEMKGLVAQMPGQRFSRAQTITT